MDNLKNASIEDLIKREDEIYLRISTLKDEMLKNLDELEYLDKEVNLIYSELNARNTKQ